MTLSRVRRERMGHIMLSCPVSHVWYFKGASSPLATFLDISQKSLESVIYYASHLVVSIDEDKKKEALATLNSTIEARKQQLLKDKEVEEKKITEDSGERQDEAGKMKTEQKKLIGQELELMRRQKLARLNQRVEEEGKKIEEIATALSNLLKSLKVSSVLSEDEYFKILEYDIPVFFDMKTGAEAVLDLMKGMDLDKMIIQLREELVDAGGQKYLKLIKRVRLIENMKKAGIDPKAMILTALPVIPPDLRPMVQLAGGRFATSDLNDLYRRVINRNNRLKHLMSLGAPEIILRNEKRMLQESVDALIDASQRGAQVVASPLRSLSDMLRGKQGRFRQNLLGKRVDYSGRSVIVVGPDLKLSECGLPKEMALEMFKPFVLREVIMRGFAPNIKSAKRFIEKRPPEVFDILEEITKNHPVLLNRAPTLHKLGIQAFFPRLIEGSAIALHPCVCTGFNADFDGDQMAVHIPLSKKAQQEAIELMMPRHNLLKPADGSPITLPNKEMALGVYYLTSLDEAKRREEEKTLIFVDSTEAFLAFSMKKITLREPITVRVQMNSSKLESIETSVGRLKFNEILLPGMKFMNEAVKASGIKKLVTSALTVYTADEVADLIDRIKSLGFYGSTQSGLSVSVFDNKMIGEKVPMTADAEKKVAKIEEDYQQGLITIEEKKRLQNDVWLRVTEAIADLTWESLDEGSVLKTIINSEGSRAGKEQLKQLSAMRGLILDPMGRIVELPIKSNFREGLNIFEYVASARGSRKGLTDSALKTANAGYLTRRLVDVSHDVIIREEECGSTDGLLVFRVDGERTAAFGDRLVGRFTQQKVTADRKTLIDQNELITPEIAKQIENSSVAEVLVRSPFTCKLSSGMCQKCYGWDFSTKKVVNKGVPVGVMAAQSIGEPGTQLTMRTRYVAGAVMQDVTHGLPRVEELFEMRTPKNLSPVAEISGKVSIETTDEGYKIVIKNAKMKPVEVQEYFVPLASDLIVKDGQDITAGTPLAAGYLDPKEVIKVKGIHPAQQYILAEAQKVYESQGIAINDKHFEVIIRKMSDKVSVETVGDTPLIPGDFITQSRFEQVNAETLSQGGEPATARQVILGITKAALFSDSWLSAASFQETTKVLTDAALEGREDKLVGLKENVIIGRLIPVEGLVFEDELPTAAEVSPQNLEERSVVEV